MAVRAWVDTIRPETGSRDGERGKLEGSGTGTGTRMGYTSTSRPSPCPLRSLYSDDDDEVPISRRTSRIRNQVDEEVEDFEEEDDDLEEEEEEEEEELEEEEEEEEEELEEEEEDDEELEEEDNEDLGSDSVHEHGQGSHEQASAVAAAPDVRVRTRTTVTNVNVCDADALECGVCFLTLRPPIFQCEVGHVVCSACRDKLEATGNGKCHVCRVATRGYRRCHAMEHLLNCIRVPCPYAAHGCDAAPPYHGQDSHRQVCPHAPCRCPGASCGFVGSTAALLDHFAGGTHNWPCTTKVCAREAFSIRLHAGFNFILLKDQDDRDGGEQAATATGSCRLFLLNVTQERLGRAISVLCIHPNATTNGALSSTQCELVFSRFGNTNLCHSYFQSSVFEVMFTDLSNGLPNPEGCFQFFVHNAAVGDGDDKNSIQVKARIFN